MLSGDNQAVFSNGSGARLSAVFQNHADRWEAMSAVGLMKGRRVTRPTIGGVKSLVGMCDSN